jgi:hypothetical protein
LRRGDFLTLEVGVRWVVFPRLKGGGSMNNDWQKWLNLTVAVIGLVIALNQFKD